MIRSIAINTSVSKKSLLCIVSIFMLALSGCGGGGTGDSSSSNFSSSSSSNSSSSSLTAYTISGTNSPGANITISGTAVSNTATTASNFSFNVQSGDSVVLTATKIGNTCSVSGSSVNPVAGAVSDLTVTCTPDTHTLAVSNPAAASVSITGTTQVNAASTATSITFNDTFGDTNVTVSASKAGNTCTVGGSAIPSPISGNVTGVTVSCTPNPFTIAVSNPATASVSITGTTQTNSASSATSITFNDTYGDSNVSVTASKAGNTCTVGGTIIPSTITGNVTGVTISCTPIAYTLSGTNNTGAILSANGSTAATGNAITGTTSFSLSARYGDPVAFTATKTGNTCSVSGSSVNPVAGTVSDLSVTCTPAPFTIAVSNPATASVSITGTTQVNAPSSATSITFNDTYGDTNVTVSASKAGNTCTVGGTTIPNPITGNVTGVTVTCTPNPFTIAISNPAAASVSITGTTQVNAPSTATSITFNDTYGDTNVTVSASKTGNTCTVGGSAIPNPITGNITGVTVTCNPITYTVSGTVTGNTGPVILINAGVTNTVSATGGDFSFTVNSGSNWNVSVSSKPDSQTCLLNGGPVSGSNIQSDQISILVQCTDNTYTVSGSITGYNSSGSSLLALELKDTTTSGTLQTLTNITNTSAAFNFTSPVVPGHDWSVTVVNQPTGQTCSLTANGSGTNITGNVSNVAVSCSNNSGTTYTVSGTVSGHTGTVTLTNNGANPQTVSIGGSNFTFTAQNAGTNYSVTAASANGQACSVSTNGTGSNISSDISNVVVTCLNANIILGTPTSNSIAMKLFTPDQNGTVSVSYGTSSGTTYSASTTPAALIAGTPLTINLISLNSDGQYYYRLNFTPAAGSTSQTEEYQFHTARPAGSSFTFTMQADPHMDDKSEYALYTQTLLNVASDKPDFHIDLGDTFMTEKWYTYSVQSCTAVALPDCPAILLQSPVTDQLQTQARYKYELGNFGKVAKTVPLFLVNGNHDAELGWLAPVTTLPTWAYTARMQYFLSPVKDSFYDGVVYSSGATRLPSYYSWRWGDALFVALDPFFYSNKTSKNQSGWNMTLGTTQYQWLATTLANATADGVKYKFIFMHNLVGGVPEINKATGSPDIDPTTTKPYIGGSMRGGAQAAKYFEWGGLDYDGTTNLFATKRLASQGWTVPIHQLLVNNKVTAVFHGHDHLYNKEILDGVVYQEVPQPSAASTSNGTTLAKEGGYISGIGDSNSGYLRVTTTPTGVTTQYIRTWLPIGTPGTSNVENATTRINKQVSQSWSCTYQSSGTNSGWCQQIP